MLKVGGIILSTGIDQLTASCVVRISMKIIRFMDQANVLKRVCRCGHFWFEDVEDGWESCWYCGSIRNVQDGKVDHVEVVVEANYRLTRGL